MTENLYVYAITPEAVTPASEAVDGSRRFGSVEAGGICAIYTPVPSDEFSQDEIDRRASDIEWLGAIGYRHQAVVGELARSAGVVPLRAFTLFSSEQSLRKYLLDHGKTLRKTLERLDGKQEWTLRIELDPERWSAALESRVETLRDLQGEAEQAPPGRAFLLRKKIDEEKKRVSRIAEEDLVGEIERAVVEKLNCETVAESRERRGGAFPQINVLVDRDEDALLHEIHDDLMSRYRDQGVTVGLTGPWPPYTFAAVEDERTAGDSEGSSNGG